MPRPDLDALAASFLADLSAAADPAALEEVRRAHTGKKSPLKEALRSLKDVPPEDRPTVAKEVNDAAERFEAALTERGQTLEAQALALRLQREWQDQTLPGIALERGATHPLSQVEARCLEVLRQLGFTLEDGPEVEHPFYNFDALNIPEHHPARDAQDTFWVTGGWLLRSHTTTVQARLLEQRRAPPIRVVSRGRVYRNEAVDATHTAMFHQFEGIWIDRGLSFAHLQGTLAFVVRSLYGEGRIRFKPKFYPYTEPSVGVDLACGSCQGEGALGGTACDACHGAGWITILGAGMIHPKVLLAFGYDPNEVSGIAFGLGTTRMAAQKAGISKAASLYESDLRVHRTVHRGTR
jgi:phenylalanyl-tRNA synthetase alpha chain